MKCLKCGSENGFGAKFCGTCGNDLEEQQKAYLQEQERLAREQKEKQERIVEARRKQLELRRGWVRRWFYGWLGR